MSANLERFSGLAGVYGAFRPVPPAELIDVLTLRSEAERLLGNEPKPWYWSYRVRVAVK